MENFKFNIGDKVKQVSGGYFCSQPNEFFPSCNTYIDNTERIIIDRKFDSKNNINWYLTEDYTNWFTENGLNLSIINETELLEKAKRDYPLKSEFKCVKNGNKFTVNNYFYHTNDKCIYSEVHRNGGGRIYSEGIWAIIVNKPIEEEWKLKFKVGDKLQKTNSLATVQISEIGKDSNKSYKLNSSSGWDTQQWVEDNYTLIEKQEIQSMKQEGELKVGGYYYAFIENSGNWYFQFEKFENGNTYHTYARKDEISGYFDKKGHFASVLTSIKEVTENEAKGIPSSTTSNKEEDLVGRYFKVLKLDLYNNHQYLLITTHKKGEITVLTKEFPGTWMSVEYRTKDEKGLELMPKDFIPNKQENEYMKFTDDLIGKIVSLKYDNQTYPECLVILEDGKYRFLNNFQPNNDQHKDKSTYKYSLIFNDINQVNVNCKEIKIVSEGKVVKKANELILFTKRPEKRTNLSVLPTQNPIIQRKTGRKRQTLTII